METKPSWILLRDLRDGSAFSFRLTNQVNLLMWRIAENKQNPWMVRCRNLTTGEEFNASLLEQIYPYGEEDAYTVGATSSYDRDLINGDPDDNYKQPGGWIWAKSEAAKAFLAQSNGYIQFAEDREPIHCSVYRIALRGPINLAANSLDYQKGSLNEGLVSGYGVMALKTDARVVEKV